MEVAKVPRGDFSGIFGIFLGCRVHSWGMQLDEAVERFLNHLGVSRAPNTVKAYGTDLAQFVEYALSTGVSEVEMVSERLVRAWLDSHRAAHRSTRARKLYALRSFFRFCRAMGWLQVDPAAQIAEPSVARRLPRFLTRAQVAQLVEQPLQTPQLLALRDRAMLELLYATGLRVSELVSLDVNAIDFEQGAIRVRGKGGRERLVLFGRAAHEALTEYLQHVRPRLMNPRRPTRALFLNYQGGRITARSVHRLLKRYGHALGLEVSPHLLRHTFATHMLEGGADLRSVQELLGHQRLQTTQVYTHLTLDRLRRTLERALPTTLDEEEER